MHRQAILSGVYIRQLINEQGCLWIWIGVQLTEGLEVSGIIGYNDLVVQK